MITDKTEYSTKRSILNVLLIYYYYIRLSVNRPKLWSIWTPRLHSAHPLFYSCLIHIVRLPTLVIFFWFPIPVVSQIEHQANEIRFGANHSSSFMDIFMFNLSWFQCCSFSLMSTIYQEISSTGMRVNIIRILERRRIHRLAIRAIHFQVWIENRLTVRCHADRKQSNLSWSFWEYMILFT